MDDAYGRIGDPIGEIRPDMYQLIVSDYVQYINPHDFNLSCEGINPSNYFITSGDAVEKTRALYRDLHKHMRTISAQTDSDSSKYVEALESQLKQITRLMDDLILARGDAIFLETEFSASRTLMVIPKNPRKK